jgi:segregation and condensation protein B
MPISSNPDETPAWIKGDLPVEPSEVVPETPNAAPEPAGADPGAVDEPLAPADEPLVIVLETIVAEPDEQATELATEAPETEFPAEPGDDERQSIIVVVEEIALEPEAELERDASPADEPEAAAEIDALLDDEEASEAGPETLVVVERDPAVEADMLLEDEAVSEPEPEATPIAELEAAAEIDALLEIEEEAELGPATAAEGEPAAALDGTEAVPVEPFALELVAAVDESVPAAEAPSGESAPAEPAAQEPAPPEVPVLEDLSLEAQIESLLFVADGAVPVSRLAEALEVSNREVETALTELAHNYRQRGLSLQRFRDKVQLTTSPSAAARVERFLGLAAATPLSRAALEALAIVAYQQPVTRPQIEAVRGVNSDSVIKNLLSKGLIEESGRAEGPGRPVLYATTPEFMQHFGLTSLADLPPLTLPAPDASVSHEQILKG